MFVLAFFLAIFSYIIFFLGIYGVLFRAQLVALSLIFVGVFLFYQRKSILAILERIPTYLSKNGSPIFLLLLGSVFLQVFINFIGVLGPELGFDALWYHLTIPKLFLSWHQVRHISGGLLYYSDMPKLVDMLYIPGILFGQEAGAKIIHFSFGILCCIALYKLSRKFFTPVLCLMTVAIFYSNLVVGWESISAYIDLGRAFFFIMAVWGFINWYETRTYRWFVISAVLVGIGIGTKLLAAIDMGVFIPILFYMSLREKRIMYKEIGMFAVVAFIIPLPWLIFSYLNTRNPVYPIFSSIYPFASNVRLNALEFIKIVWTEFTHSADPISPMYIIFLPCLVLIKKWEKKILLVLSIGILSVIAWYISPQTGGGRFLLPYLPILSILVVYVYKNFPTKFLKKIFLVVCFATILVSLAYRGIANAKFIYVIFGQQTKASFLSSHLNFSFGDFYDIDGYMTTHIKRGDNVLIYGYHNLFYVDFPYIHESWVKKGDRFNYIATDKPNLPVRFSTWSLVYSNPVNHLHLFRDKGNIWTY